MATKRDAILQGTARAAELHDELGLKKKLAAGDRPVDVLAAMHHVGLAVLFRPLDGLLGAYIPLGRSAGAVITTQRGLHIQRFTQGHELGHHVLEHKASVDQDVGFVARGERKGFDSQEIEADAFASEFLLPIWLVAAHIRRQGWGRNNLADPSIAYQLALRLGVSFTALCWALVGHRFITADIGRDLRESQPKKAKQIAAEGAEPSSWHADVWAISEKDNGTVLLGGPDDLLVVALKEHSAAGYAWTTDGATSIGLRIERDERDIPETKTVGGPVTRRLIFKGDIEGILTLEERRPWEKKADANDVFKLQVALHGKETEGLPRSFRRVA